MTEQTQDAGRLICKIGEDGYVRERGDWIDISEDGQSERTYVYVDQLVAVRQQLDQYKWRSVEDGLPEEGVCVLLSAGPFADPITAVYSRRPDHEAYPLWYSYEGEEWIMGVSHWMPIPTLHTKRQGSE